MSSPIIGKHAVKAAIDSNQDIDRVEVSFTRKHTPEIKEILSLCKKRNIPVKFKSLEKEAYGIIAHLRQKRETSFKEFLNSPLPDIILALDHLEDPFNLGGILRTAESFGIQTVMYPKDRQVPITPGVVKASSGAIHHLDLIKVTNLADSLITLQKKGYWLYGADSNTGMPLGSANINFPMVLVVGNESKGISKRVRSLLDETLKISTVGQTSSLNVSVATGIIVHSITAQRGKKDAETH